MASDENLLRTLRHYNTICSMDVVCVLVSGTFVVEHQVVLGINFGHKDLNVVFVMEVLGCTHDDFLVVCNIQKIQVFCHFQAQQYRAAVAILFAEFWRYFNQIVSANFRYRH